MKSKKTLFMELKKHTLFITNICCENNNEMNDLSRFIGITIIIIFFD